jgi:hypothetical protein
MCTVRKFVPCAHQRPFTVPSERMHGPTRARSVMRDFSDDGPLTVLLHNVAAHNVNVTGRICYLCSCTQRKHTKYKSVKT